MDMGEHWPLVEPVLATLKALREKIDTLKSNREELAALHERCSYMAACVIVKRRQGSSVINVEPLVKRVEEVERLVERCGRRGIFMRVLKAESDKAEIAKLHARIGDLTGDMGLAGIASVDEKVEDLTTMLVSDQPAHRALHEIFIKRPVARNKQSPDYKTHILIGIRSTFFNANGKTAGV